MKQKIVFVCLFLPLFYFFSAGAQSFYDLNTIQKIEIYFSQPGWDYRLDTAKHGSDGYIHADWVKINGVEYDSVGVKYKGNSSYDSTYLKNPIHIALDEYTEQSYQGYKDIKLGNGYADPSLIREVLSYNILSAYMHCPQSNFAQLYINSNYTGLYSNVESVNKKFCKTHFYSNTNTLIKCNPLLNPGPATKSNLKYIAADSSAYFNYYEVKSDFGWNDLVVLCDSVTNHSENISSILDMDRVLWMLAFNNVLVNLDSYSGVFCQNYYLYKDHTGHYNPIVWDLNMSFGGLPFAGVLNSSMGTLTVTNMEQLSLSIHAGDPYWPLINAVMNDPTYKRMYMAHIRTLTNEVFATGNYQTLASHLQSVIDTAVLSDANNFFTYSQFQNGMTTDNIFGSYTVPGISNLMNARLTYLQATPEFNSAAPVIVFIAESDSAPALNSKVNITATVSLANDSSVYLGYRYSSTEKFVRVRMYDDGFHDDGAAGDSLFGAAVNITSSEMQYYVYAGNSDAGTFLPARAEHEFFSLKTKSPESGSADFSVYPNPANEVLSVVLNNESTGKFEILNMIGEVVYSGELNTSATIQTGNFRRGVYFCRLNDTIQKIIIMH